MTAAQRTYLDSMARELGQGDAYDLLARHCGCTRDEAQRLPEFGGPTGAAISDCIDAAKEAVALARAAKTGLAQAETPAGTVIVHVPARGNDLQAPSHSKGYGRWRFVGEGSWRSGRYEGPARSGRIEIEKMLRRKSGGQDKSTITVPVAPGRYKRSEEHTSE